MTFSFDPAEEYMPPADAVVQYADAFLDGRSIPCPVYLYQYDASYPVLAMRLRFDDRDYTVPAGAAVNVRMSKPDLTSVYNPALGVSSDRNTVYVEITRQMTAAAGSGRLIVEIVKGNKVVGAGTVDLKIKQNPVNDSYPLSEGDYSALLKTITEITVDIACPVTDSGMQPVAQVTDLLGGYDVPLQVIAQIEPQQSGTGDPSPSNIRPIKGVGNLTITRCGANLLDMERVKAKDNSGFKIFFANNVLSVDGVGTKQFVDLTQYTMPLLPLHHPQVYTLSISKPLGSNLICAVKNAEGKDSVRSRISAGQTRTTINVDGTEQRLWLYLGTTAGEERHEKFSLQIEVGSISTADTPFEPYNGKDYAVNFDHTVYGAQVDFTGGKIAETKFGIRFTGSETFLQASDNPNKFYINMSVNKYPLGVPLELPLSSHYQTGLYTGVYIDPNGRLVMIVPQDTESAFRQYLRDQAAAGTPVQVVYTRKVAAKQEIPPQKILQLEGTNTAYHSANGSTRLIGRQDPKKVCCTIKNAIIATGGDV